MTWSMFVPRSCRQQTGRLLERFDEILQVILDLLPGIEGQAELRFDLAQIEKDGVFGIAFIFDHDLAFRTDHLDGPSGDLFPGSPVLRETEVNFAIDIGVQDSGIDSGEVAGPDELGAVALGHFNLAAGQRVLYDILEPGIAIDRCAGHDWVADGVARPDDIAAHGRLASKGK